MPQRNKEAKVNGNGPHGADDQEIVGLLLPEYVAGKLGVSRSMVYKLVQTGELEAVHIGRLVRISPDSYKRLIGQ